MALSPRLDLRQSQSLVMTPQLQQAIRLLALSNLELESYIAEEIERNPLLDSGEERSDGGDGEPSPSDADSSDNASDYEDLVQSEFAGADAALDMDAPDDQFASSDAALAQSGTDGALGLNHIEGAGSGSVDGPDFDNMLSAEQTLPQYLLEQAGAQLSGQELFVASHIIDQIDECGYFRGDVLETAHRLGVAKDMVEQVLSVIQSFDPVGVGARNLAECLAIQARDADRYDPAMARLIGNLDLLARGALAQLKRICGVDDEDLMDMIAELRAYDPKPGCKIGGGVIETVIPDLFVTEKSGKWLIEINSATLPKVLINRSYYAELKSGAQDKAAKEWLGEAFADANWLVKALDQRQRTIIKTATEIVKQQENFFRHGVAYLRPLTLKTVADAIEMHESTVSRVTSNKYLSCSRGMFELKYFFTSGIQATDGGDAVSAEAVKAQIKALIDAEDAKKILSDDTLVELLREKGFDIARRTVAKYREQLGILSSSKRKQVF
jgi:RNA polymerase sigma-54 factor